MSTTDIYTLSLHDALPIWQTEVVDALRGGGRDAALQAHIASVAVGQGAPKLNCIELGEDLNQMLDDLDRKSTRLNSSHVKISYAVFCLKKKNITQSVYMN